MPYFHSTWCAIFDAASLVTATAYVAIGCSPAGRDTLIPWPITTLILITLLVKLGVAAAVASALARARTFQRLLFADRRSRYQTMGLLAFFLVPLTLGVWVRTTVPNFLAADISFETIILLGLLLGPSWAMLGGAGAVGPRRLSAA